MDMKPLLLSMADAINRKKKLTLRFLSKDKGELTRTCAPLDVATSRKAKEKHFKFHFWDYDSTPNPHILSIKPDRIIELTILEDSFYPEEIVTWDTQKSPWFIKRDWGSLS